MNIRYVKGKNKGEINLKKFVNTLDCSLELPKINEIYEKKYRNRRFTFERNGHSYSTRIINVTYNYAVKEWNKEFKNIYVKLGHKYSEIEFKDNVCIIGNELIGIIINEKVEIPISDELLGSYFFFSEGQYCCSDDIPVVKTTKELREYTYLNGFYCDGIKFIRYKRSSGASRVGKCLFIDEKLYQEIRKWQQCGLDVKDGQDIDLAAYEAYISLPLSSIIDTIEIKPENILLIDDYNSVFFNDVIETIDINNELVSRENRIEISNSIWDGQSLIDKSLMGGYQDKGMLLLRNRFFKSCCFNSNIQDWFRDNGITDINQLNGVTRAKNIQDIKLITTPNSIKYLKFGTFDQWLDNIEEIFGIVKYEKPTHHFDGEMVQTHYQLLNTLQLSENEINELLDNSFDFLDKLKDDPSVLRYFISYPLYGLSDITPALSKNDIVYKLLGINDKFAKTKIYDDFKKDLIKSQIKMIRCGKIYVNGNYSTLCGNPIEMLQASIGAFKGNSYFDKGTISTQRFDYNEEILGTRSPHVSPGCVLIVTNKRYDLIEKYMNGTNEIVYVNSIEENLLNRLSGCDFDSDSLLLANNKILLEAAKKNYDLFKVSVCNVRAKKINRTYTSEEKADLDYNTSNNLIGQIVNLAQILMSLFWDRYNKGSTYEEIKDIYFDICQLNILSMLEIDKAKKEYAIDSQYELEKIREKYLQKDKEGRTIKPYFFKFVQQYKGYFDSNKNNYKSHKCSMDFLEHAINRYQRGRKGISKKNDFIKFYAILNIENYQAKNTYREQVARIVRLIKDYKLICTEISSQEFVSNEIKFKRKFEERQKIIEYIGNLKFSRNTMVYMLKTLDNKKYEKEYRTIFEFLFGYPNSSFYELIEHSKEPVYSLEKCNDGDICLFDIRFKRQKIAKIG